MISSAEFDELLKRDDWELQWAIKHKEDPDNYTLDVPVFKEHCEKVLQDCETGMVLGEGWQGGMTREEWQKEKTYFEKVISYL